MRASSDSEIKRRLGNEGSSLPPTGKETSCLRQSGPQAVLFDLDGTLVDTGPDIAAAVNRMLADVGRPVHDTARILEWVGEGSPRLVQRALTGRMDGEASRQDFERGLALFYRYYAAGICDQSEPYPHVRRVLEDLGDSPVRLGCVTNKPEHMTRLLFDALELAPLFDVIVGGDTLEFRKPHPGPIRYACDRLEVRPADTVYVGDSITDCRAAEAAGVTMVAVSYGYNRGVDLTQGPCAAIIDDLGELPRILSDVSLQ